MIAWLYISSVVIQDTKMGDRITHFEHCVVMARTPQEACKKGWRKFCKHDLPFIPNGWHIVANTRGETAIQLVQP